MKLTLYMAMSLDGLIAKDDDSTNWSKAEWELYSDFVKSKGNIILGRKTYDMMKADKDFNGIGHPFTVILSDSRGGSQDGKTMFVKTPEEAIAVMKGQGFLEVVLGGGTGANTAFLQAGLIDEIVLDVEPIFLDSGKHLFNPGTVIPPLKVIKAEPTNQRLLRVHYKVTGKA